MIRSAIAAASLLLAAGGTTLADGVPAETGEALALDYCGACHRVSQAQPAPGSVVIDTGLGIEEFTPPSFRQIARLPGRDAPYLERHIQNPPYPMPEQLFIAEELARIVAYIRSLRDQDAAEDW